MPATVLQVIRTVSAPADIALGLLTFAQRADVKAHGALIEDASGSPIDTLILIETDNGSDGARSLSVRLAGPDDHLSQAQIGDTL